MKNIIYEIRVVEDGKTIASATRKAKVIWSRPDNEDVMALSLEKDDFVEHVIKQVERAMIKDIEHTAGSVARELVEEVRKQEEKST